MTGKQLIEHRAKSVDICRAANGCVVSHRLLWRHVTRCAQHVHTAGESTFFFYETGQSEISQMRRTVGVDKNVTRFDVAMQNAVFVRTVNGARQRSEEHTSALQSIRHLVCRTLL